MSGTNIRPGSGERDDDVAATPSPNDPLNLMGDDGTGRCWGCGNHLDRIDVDCPVCLQALDHIADGGDAKEAFTNG